MRNSEGTFRPVYRHLVDDILEKIESGVYPNGSMLPSERELCLQYNVSRQTVRNALKLLSQQGWVSPRAGKGTRIQSPPVKPGQVLKVAPAKSRQIGYICNAKAYAGDACFLDHLLGFKSALSQEGYSVAFSVSRKDESKAIYPIYQDWLRNNAMEGYICASVHPSLQRELANLGVPAVSLGYVWENIDLPALALDFRRIYRNAVAYLHERGHERICNLVLNDDNKFSREVLAGYDEGRLALNKSTAEISVERSADTAYDIVAALRRVLKAKPQPSAIILSGDDHLNAIMRFFANEGIRIPDDLFIMAVQVNPGNCRYADELAYFSYSSMDMARRAAQKLVEILTVGDTHPRQELFYEGRFISPGELMPSLHLPEQEAPAVTSAPSSK